jgi:hypothetical protein
MAVDSNIALAATSAAKERLFDLRSTMAFLPTFATASS